MQDDHDERKVLTGLLRLIERPNNSLLASNWPVFGVWLLFAGGFMYLFKTGMQSPLHPLILALGSTCLGIAGAWVVLLSVIARQWPYLREHIDVESVRARLAELDD
ncbi:hypothetical protein ABQW55_022660 [Xanthomonas citri pv. malvacearum]|uniref:Uncharacterized protein n=1 Tax=Xanthomonas campestris pv. malvacearum TaxID=86040 RepID=A0AA44YYW3_XANCM|nr:hypothetical protein [Xanthomonas citri]OOW63037.1 hypothetical protein Xths_13485 [Xanthomonas campestris pv. thespesiae]OOW82559.1 hypothetical protein Xlen_06860 [Xanthomonas campestris pv. leeana]AOL21374.1 hypothetical protein BGK55_21415 [Xanthomonas citri pv. malvacearum]ASN03420.1 hypothetical protein APY29_22275 [Xanthomonas citri pv. malvacearum]ASN11644.1 hypothetical protein APY30_22230 [Xanthomonas citri pv. malvacearum]